SLEVGYGPALMISAPSTSSQLHATTEDAAQAPANPAVDVSECGPVTVLEVVEPSSKDRVQQIDDLREAPPVVAARVLAELLPQAYHALLARPSHASLEVVAEEVKASTLRRIDEFRLLGMKRELALGHQLAEKGQGFLGIPFRTAEDH